MSPPSLLKGVIDLGDPTFFWEVTGALGTRAEASSIVVVSAGKEMADTGWTNLDNACVTVDGLAEQFTPAHPLRMARFGAH